MKILYRLNIWLHSLCSYFDIVKASIKIFILSSVCLKKAGWTDGDKILRRGLYIKWCCTRYYLLIYSTVQSPSWAANRFAASQEIPRNSRRSITALTSVRHLSLSWASPIQSIYLYPTSWRSILILPTHLRLGLTSGLFPSDFPTKTLYTPIINISFFN